MLNQDSYTGPGWGLWSSHSCRPAADKLQLLLAGKNCSSAAQQRRALWICSWAAAGDAVPRSGLRV
jgi:hypothetical protein